MTIHFDLCCNDPDNGLFAGRLLGFTIGKSEIEFEARDATGPAMKHIPGGIVVTRAHFQCKFAIEWIGNWCWNRYDFEDVEALRFLQWIRARRSFHLSCGESRFCTAWAAAGEISNERLIDVLKGALDD